MIIDQIGRHEVPGYQLIITCTISEKPNVFFSCKRPLLKYQLSKIRENITCRDTFYANSSILENTQIGKVSGCDEF